jgi:inhibitor of KinA
LNFQLIPSGDTSIVVEFGDRIDRDVNRRVLNATTVLKSANIKGIIEVVPTYRSLMVHYDPLKVSSKLLEDLLPPLLEIDDSYEIQARRWHIPVCYEHELAPDLEYVARSAGMSTGDVARLHSSKSYHVYMIGFLPGFPYMGDLPEELRLPRRDTPRVNVPMGSVAIAMAMTAVYPVESPGGWHLIGTTPIQMFDSTATNPALFSAGDQVQFMEISNADFLAMESEVASGSFTLTSEEI